MKKKKIAVDLIYSIAGVAFFNIILQFIVYPYVNAKIGNEQFGEMLFLLAVVNIVAPSFGNAVNNTRMVLPDREQAKNGDFVSILGIFAGITVLICAVIAGIRGLSVWSAVALIAVSIMTMLRFYANVEYRLNLAFKKQLLFYGLLGIGYLLGMVPFLMTGHWEWVFLLGEVLAVLCVVLSGQVFRHSGEVSSRRKEIFRNSFTLAGSYLLTNLMLQLDRFVLLYFVDGNAVSEYYVLSLLGKTVAIIGIPLNSIIIGYLTKGEMQLTKASFRKSVLGLLLLAVAFTFVCGIGTPIYIRVMYADLYSKIPNLWFASFVVSLAQILYFVTNILLVMILTFVESKWQLIIQITYAVIFVALAIGMTIGWGLMGFAYAACLSSGCYFLFTALTGMYYIRKK